MEYRTSHLRGTSFRGDPLILSTLAAVLNLPQDVLRLERNSWGKPQLPPGISPLPLHFNLSHSGALVVLALCLRGEVGVDVEERVARSDPGRLVKRFFAPGEQAWYFSPEVTGLDDPHRLNLYYDLWSRKEAVVKALGRGLGFGLGKFEAGVPGLGWQDVAAGEGSRLQVRNLDHFPGWSGAIALVCPPGECGNQER